MPARALQLVELQEVVRVEVGSRVALEQHPGAVDEQALAAGAHVGVQADDRADADEALERGLELAGGDLVLRPGEALGGRRTLHFRRRTTTAQRERAEQGEGGEGDGEELHAVAGLALLWPRSSVPRLVNSTNSKSALLR